MFSASLREWLTAAQLRFPFPKHLVAVALLLFFGSYVSARAATIVVPAGGDLQAALNASNCGDQIIVQGGHLLLQLFPALQRPV